ncbi:hypothetical protein ACQZ5D_03380 [Agrobacterium sp. 22-211-1]
MIEVIPFFHDLPALAVPSAARLWDEAQSISYNGQTAYQDFAQDLRFLHIEPPARSIVKRWIAGVQANLIARPGGEKPKPDAPVQAVAAISPEKRREPVNDRLHRRAIEQEKLAAALPEFQPSPVKAKAELAVRDAEVSPVAGLLKFLGGVSEVEPADASNDFDVFAAKLFEVTLAEIKRDAEAKAAKLVASRLREIADRYDASAA